MSPDSSKYYNQFFQFQIYRKKDQDDQASKKFS